MYLLKDQQYATIDEFHEAYFAELASRLFSHSDTVPAFFYNNDIESISAFEAAVANRQVQLPALIIDAFDDGFTMPLSHLQETLSFSMTVIDYYEQGNPADLKRARRQCRADSKKLLFKMLRDTKTMGEALLLNNKVWVLNEANITGMYIGVMDDIYTGWTYQIEWNIPTDLHCGIHELGE